MAKTPDKATPSPEDPRVTRSKRIILATSLEIMSELGVNSTTVEAIAERSGVAKTTIYRHWPSKAELVIDAFEELATSPIDPDTGSLAGDLTALANGLAIALAKGRWTSLLPSLIESAERHPDLAALHQRFADSRHEAVRSVVGRARSRGEVRSDVSDDELIDLIAGPLFYRRLVAHDPADNRYASRLATLVLELVTPKDTPV